MEGPSEARVLDGDLSSYALARREARESQLRKEGFDSAAQTAAHALELAGDKLIGCRDDLEASAVMLAMDIAQELLRVELGKGNYDITKIVREVLASHSGSTGSTILHVNPEDAASLADVPFRSGTQIQADPSIRRGDVRLQTDQGMMVREMDECLKSIRNKLIEATS